MAISDKHLGQGESVVMTMRTHMKELALPIVIFIALAGLLGTGIAFMPQNTQPWGNIVLGVVALALFVWFVFIPFLRWRTSTYTITDRRIITRRGIINVTGHDLPLRRINNVNYERSITDRMLGCGTLILETAAGQPLVLPDVPNVERVHVAITELLFGNGEGQDEKDSDE